MINRFAGKDIDLAEKYVTVGTNVVPASDISLQCSAGRRISRSLDDRYSAALVSLVSMGYRLPLRRARGRRTGTAAPSIMANPAAYRARVTRAGRSLAAFIRIAALTLSSARTFTEKSRTP